MTKSRRTAQPNGNNCGSTKIGALATAAKLMGWNNAKQSVPTASAIRIAARRARPPQSVTAISTTTASAPEPKLTRGKPGVARLPIQLGSATFEI